jgi:DNA-binding SARP family transcriptional activator/TolB-like protein
VRRHSGDSPFPKRTLAVPQASGVATVVERSPVQLRILGHTELICTGARTGSFVLRQPKRLALLAYLALNTADGYRRRDQLIALFWPELDQAHARGQLRKVLHALRATIGADAIALRGEEEVRLDPRFFRCDAVTFRTLVEEKRWREAIAIYRGDLLEGLYPGGVGEDFQSWLDEQRSALRRLAARAAWSCANDARAAGDRAGALSMARLALRLRPDDEAQLRDMLRMLDEFGDRAGALSDYEEWKSWLAREFGAEPDPETRRLVKHIQATRKGESLESSPEVTAKNVALIAAVVEADSPSERIPVSVAVAPRTPARSLDGLRQGVGAALLVVGLSTVAFAVGVVVANRGLLRSLGFADTHASVAVLPLRQLGDSGIGRIADGVGEELTMALARRSGISVRASAQARSVATDANVADIGQRLRVHYVVDGSAHGARDRGRVMLRLVRVRDAVTVWADAFDINAADVMGEQQRIAALAIREISPRLVDPTASPSQRR